MTCKSFFTLNDQLVTLVVKELDKELVLVQVPLTVVLTSTVLQENALLLVKCTTQTLLNAVKPF